MRKLMLFFLLTVNACLLLKAQVKIGGDPGTISPGSILELESTSKALTLPRMTTVQMNAIPSPVKGMIVFNVDSNCIYLYKANNSWSSINPEPVTPTHWPYNSDPALTGNEVLGNANGIIALTGSGLAATGDYSHAEGLNSLAGGDYSWSSGFEDTASGTAAVTMGYQNKALGAYSFATGNKNVAAYQSSVAMGQENYDSGWASMTMGLRNKIFNQISYSNILGYSNEIRGGWSNTILGESNIVKGGRANTTIGAANEADGNYYSLLGNNNRSEGGSAGIAGGSGNVIKSGASSSLFGFSNIAEGNYLGAIGKTNIVYFQSAVALGQNNRDSGYASIAGGLNNTIENNVLYSAAFGQNNISTRNLSLLSTIAGAGTFSAGIANVNSGFSSIALGAGNRPSNAYSFAANQNTLSNSNSMSAFGHFNDTIPALQGLSYAPEEMLFSIGNGISNTARRNSFTMLRNGFTTINTTEETGPNSPRAELDVKGTGAIIVPVGTSAQRPLAPVQGMIRMCSDCGPGGTAIMQGYDGTNWVNL